MMSKMTDIVERLRDGGVFPMTFGGPDVKDVVILYDPMTPTDAIKEIERLRAALREILDSVAVTASGVEICQCSDFDFARRALEGRDG